jgi:hypothetical protein
MSHELPQFYQHRDLSFVGRPFPLSEADEHFGRLRRWGLTFLRLVVPWEAIEHAGPGQYDQEYLHYVYQLVERAHRHGLQAVIDPHQDVWSRLSGGAGAPGWTFEIVGLEVSQFHACGAALIHAFDREPLVMQWPVNYHRLAAMTMFTLFWGGNDFAPEVTVAGESMQEFLQRHYVNAFTQVALTLKDLPNVAGFGTMNEPSSGFIGLPNLAVYPELHLPLGPLPTPFQTMLLGAGYPQEVEAWRLGVFGPQAQGKVWVNPAGGRVWQEGRTCLWQEHGVWNIDAAGQPRLLRPEYFARIRRHGRQTPVDFGRDYLKPFVKTYAQAIQAVQPGSLIFVEPVPHTEVPPWSLEELPHLVNAGHWYDYFTVFTRWFWPFLNMDIAARKMVFGRKQIHKMFRAQLAALKQSSLERMGGAPTLVGEFGTPFNMPLKLNYRLNWFGMQEWALDANFQALEANLLSATLWNYTADHHNGAGDRWNGEDFSIFSRDQQRQPDDLDSGGRALRAVVRPYPCRTAGEPLEMAFDYRRRHFTFTFRHDPTIHMPTEIFIPALHFGQEYHVAVSDGTYEKDPANQRLTYWPGAEREVHVIRVWATP